MEELLARQGFEQLSHFASTKFGIACAAPNIYISTNAPVPQERASTCQSELFDVVDLLSQAMKYNGGRNHLSNGYSRSSECWQNINTTQNLFLSARWRNIFIVLGREKSLFLLTKCTVVEIINNSAILLCGSIREASLPEEAKKYSFERHTIFEGRRALDPHTFEDASAYIMDGLAFSEAAHDRILRGIYKLVRSCNMLPVKSLYSSFFQDTIELDNVLENAIEPVQLVDFMFLVAKKTLGRTLTSKAFPAIRGKLTLFIKRNGSESLAISEITKYVSLSSIKLLPKRIKRQDRAASSVLRTRLLLYIFNKIFIPVFSVCFYSTTCMNSKLLVRYFHRTYWNRATTAFYKNYFSRFERTGGKGHALTLRCIPRNGSFRVITNCSRKLKSSGKSLNYRLSPFLALLQSVPLSERSRSLECTNHVGRKLSELSKLPSQKRNFLIKIDLSNCFDTINHDYLLKIVHNAFTKDLYYFSEFKLFSEKKGLQTENTTERGSTKCKFSTLEPKKLRLTEEYPCSVERLCLEHHKRVENTIVQELRHRVYDRDEVVTVLSEVICNLAIFYRNSFYKPLAGIPQGCSLSPILCDMYYTAACLEVLEPVIKRGLFCRYVDDFLLATDSLDEVKAFFKALRSLRERGFIVNPEKIESNLNRQVLTELYEDRDISEAKDDLIESSYVEWCGMRIFDSGMRIKGARPDIHFRHTVILPGSRPGIGIFQRIQCAFRQRISSALINSRNKMLGENIYDAFFSIGRRLRISMLRADFINEALITKILSWTVDELLAYISAKKIHFDSEKVRIIADKAFLKSNVRNLKTKKWNR